MLMSDKAAREKWCPVVRIDNNNRLHNSLTDGFQNSEKMYDCIAGDCMGWREFHLSHLKGERQPASRATAIAAMRGKPERE